MANGISRNANEGYACAMCWRALSDLGQVCQHIKSRGHTNKVYWREQRRDPLAIVPSEQRGFCVVEDGTPYCILCNAFWTDEHAARQRHLYRSMNPGSYMLSLRATPPAQDQGAPRTPPSQQPGSPPPPAPSATVVPHCRLTDTHHAVPDNRHQPPPTGGPPPSQRATVDIWFSGPTLYLRGRGASGSQGLNSLNPSPSQLFQ